MKRYDKQYFVKIVKSGVDQKLQFRIFKIELKSIVWLFSFFSSFESFRQSDEGLTKSEYINLKTHSLKTQETKQKRFWLFFSQFSLAFLMKIFCC